MLKGGGEIRSLKYAIFGNVMKASVCGQSRYIIIHMIA